MTREVTSTTVKVAKIDMVEGLPTAVELEPIKLLGNVGLEKAQKLASKQYGTGVTVLAVEPETQVYKLAVTDFLAVATLVEPEQSAE